MVQMMSTKTRPVTTSTVIEGSPMRLSPRWEEGVGSNMTPVLLYYCIDCCLNLIIDLFLLIVMSFLELMDRWLGYYSLRSIRTAED